MNTLTPLRFATTNADKLREAQQILQRPIEGLALVLDEIQTTDLRTLTLHKLAQAHAHLQAPVLVEDTALVFNAWGRLPGVLIRFFLEEMGCRALVRALAPFNDPRALALCGVGYHDGLEAHYFEGRNAGTIVPPRGEEGFGWDAIFQPQGALRTFAEMTPAQKAVASMRAQALRALQDFMRSSSQEGS